LPATTGEAFVLVFGSVHTPAERLGRSAIRHAVLQMPRELSYLDEFYTEAGSPDAGFGKISY
jgi:hypothetical protein